MSAADGVAPLVVSDAGCCDNLSLRDIFFTVGWARRSARGSNEARDKNLGPTPGESDRDNTGSVMGSGMGGRSESIDDDREGRMRCDPRDPTAPLGSLPPSDLGFRMPEAEPDLDGSAKERETDALSAMRGGRARGSLGGFLGGSIGGSILRVLLVIAIKSGGPRESVLACTREAT